MEIPGEGKGNPRPMMDVSTNNTFNNMIKSNYGEAPKRSKLSEFLIGHMTQHVYDSQFNSMMGNGDYV